MQKIVFIGGGNMASAIIGGLRSSGIAGSSITAVDPGADQRARLVEQFQIATLPAADASLIGTSLVVWAVKPQIFKEAAPACVPFLQGALHLSVMAGIRSDAIARIAATDKVVRSMPNTPALIGRGITGLYARAAVTSDDKAMVDSVLEPTGELLWVAEEDELDAVTAVSGSGPAYVFYFAEAMVSAAVSMGLSAAQGKTLALATFAGATELARLSEEPLSTLRERVTSKGGTTYAALSSMQADDMQALFGKAMKAAQTRAKELGDEFGA
jgi:pyrroline-5-carboxylate reductase